MIKNQKYLTLQRKFFKSYLVYSSKKNFEHQKPNFFPKDSIFLNFSFDKGRLKTIVSWFLEKYGHYKTIQFLEKLKEFGFGYATLAGLSLGIDDLKVPDQKVKLLAKAETKVTKDLMDYRNAKITGIERMQRLIYVWNQTNDTLKQEVVKYFETTDLFNPIYMMAFSGARGNMSQVRQLVGMRGLMSDPQGQIIDFPIQSNFREGLTLTEYLISTYGARKGIVDTALRTATAGYLTRRLVDVAQHVIVSQFDCGTTRGIFLFDMKEANKTIYSFQNRLIGRVLAHDILSPVCSSSDLEGKSSLSTEHIQIAFRNQEIDSQLARAISNVTKKAFVRSPLTCETPRLICQLCYGWSLSAGKLVSIGEAVGVIAAQSIGEPGTQLTMRTFHTGGVFAGGLTDQILAPFDGHLDFFHSIPGSCIRTSLSNVAFLTKAPGSFFVKKNKHDKFPLKFHTSETDESFSKLQQEWKLQNKSSNFSELYKIPAYAILFVRNKEFVQKKQLLAQFSTVLKKQVQYGTAEQTLYSTLAGEFYLGSLPPFGLGSKSAQKAFDFSTPLFSQNQNAESFFSKFIRNLEVQRLKKIQKDSSPLTFDSGKKSKGLNQPGQIDLLIEKRKSDVTDLSEMEQKQDLFWKSKNWTNIWILSGHMFSNSLKKDIFLEQGDCLKTTSVFCRILWKKSKKVSLFVSSSALKQKEHNKFSFTQLSKRIGKSSFSFDFFCDSKKNQSKRIYHQKFEKKTKNKLYLLAFEKSKKSTIFLDSPFFSSIFLPSEQIKKAFVFSFASPKGEVQKMNVQQKKRNRTRLGDTKMNLQVNSNFQFLQKLNSQKFLNKSAFSNSKNLFSFCSKRNKAFQKFPESQKIHIFSINFQKIFTFFQKPRKSKRKTQIFSLTQKKHSQQLFFKFSTFNKNVLSLDNYNYSKIFKVAKRILNSKNERVSRSSTFQFSRQNFCFHVFPFSKKTIEITFQSGTKKNRKRFPLSFFLKKKTKATRKKNFSIQKFQRNSISNFLSKNSQFFLSTNSKLKSLQGLKKILSQSSEQKNFFFYQTKETSFSLFLPLKKRQTHPKQELQELENDKNIFFKKSVLTFQFDTLRSNNFGYVSTLSNSLTYPNLLNTQSSIQLFIPKSQESQLDFLKTTNPGKNEISLGNSNFFGKDFPTFLGYCFPNNYQTSTNGIFTLLSFDKNSLTKRSRKFLCSNSKFLTKVSFLGGSKKKLVNANVFPLFLTNGKKKFENGEHQAFFSKTKKDKKNFQIFQKEVSQFSAFLFVELLKSSSIFNIQQTKKAKGTSFFSKKKQAKKVFFFQIATFDFFDSYSNSKQFFLSFLSSKKNIVHYTFSNQVVSNQLNQDPTFQLQSFFYFQKRTILFPNFFKPLNSGFRSTLCLMNSLPSKSFFEARNQLCSQKFSTNFRVLLKKRNCLKNQKTAENFEFYTEELFWIPQENYVLSNVQFLEKFKNQKKGKISRPEMMSFMTFSQKKKIPLFYLVNRQGKKKPFFSHFQGFYCFSNFQPFFVHSQNQKQYTKPLEKYNFIFQKLTFFETNAKEETIRKQENKKMFNPSNTFVFEKRKSKKMASQRFSKSQQNGVSKNQYSLFSKQIQQKNQLNHFLKSSLLARSHKNKQSLRKIVESYASLKPTINKKKKTKLKTQVLKRFFSKNCFSNQFLRIHSKFYLRAMKNKKIKRCKNIQTNSQFNIYKFTKNLKKNFSCGFLKKKQDKKLQTLQTLFLNEFENLACSKKSKNFSFTKNLSNRCFTCIPLKKHKSLKKVQTRNEFTNSTNTLSLQTSQVHLKIQSGWVYFVPDFFQTVEFHQTISNPGHFCQTDILFEQNKVLTETILFNHNSFGFENQKKQIEKFFSATNFYKNSKCRFVLFFKEKQMNQKDALHKFSVCHPLKMKKQLGVLFRPFQYKLLENPKNFKKIFMQSSGQFDSQRNFSKRFNSSCFELFEKYHSPVLNTQKIFKPFVQSNLNFDFELSSEFSSFQFQKKNQKNTEKEKIHLFKNKKFKRFHNLIDSRAHKKQLVQKFSFLKDYSKKSRLHKFQTLVNRENFLRNFGESSHYEIVSKKNGLSHKPKVLRSGIECHKLKKKGTLNKSKKHGKDFSYFFSFYPVQFLPIRISYLFVNNQFNSFLPCSPFLNSQKSPTLFINSLTNKIDFSMCQKKSAFYNQRVFAFSSFENFQKSSSFWLNKDGLHFHSSLFDLSLQCRSKPRLNMNIVKTSKYFTKYSKKMNMFTSLLADDKTFLEKNRKKFSSNQKIMKKSKQILMKNSFFSRNPNFYGNTKFYSPYEGELVSMVTNETNWWKKASEISTIQKVQKLFTIVTKTDFFSMTFPTKNNESPQADFEKFELSTFSEQTTSFLLNQTKQFQFSLQQKQQHLLGLYEIVFKTEKNSIFSMNFGGDSNTKKKNDNQSQGEMSFFMTKYENKIYKFQHLNVGYPNPSKKPMLGTFFVYGDCILKNAVRKPGQIVHLNRVKMTLRRGQPFLVSPKGILHLANIPFIKKNVPILTLPYQTVQSGDIVQGIPKVEQYFEARTTIQGRLFVSSLPILLKGIFERYKVTLPLEQATRQSFLKLQQIIVDGVQRVYRSQGVSITDKHLEVVVRQMTTKVQIINGAQTGFFPGELVNLDLVERINKVLMVKIRYEPVILGITRASLEVDSFLSASSFQQTTKILALASISRKKDFLKGLKENLLVGNLIPSGTGYFVLSKTFLKF